MFRKLDIILYLVIFFISSCSNSNEHNKKNMLNDDIKKAWVEKDSDFVKRWLWSLNDSNVSESKFYSMISDFSDISGFVYGNQDITKNSSYWLLNKNQRLVMRHNVALVYRIYSQTGFFMKKCNWFISLSLQEKYWNDSTLFTQKQCALIKIAIDSLTEYPAAGIVRTHQVF